MAKWKRIAIALMLVGVVTSEVGRAQTLADKPISGEARAVYIRQTAASCRVLNANVTANEVALHSYCDCMANRSADVVTFRMVETEISGTQEEKDRNWQRVLQPAAERAHPVCSAEAKRQ